MGLTDSVWSSWQRARGAAARAWNQGEQPAGSDRYARYSTTHPASGGVNPFVSGQAGSREFHRASAQFHLGACDRAEAEKRHVTAWCHHVARQMHDAAVENQPFECPSQDPRLSDHGAVNAFHHQAAEWHEGQHKKFRPEHGERADFHRFECAHHRTQSAIRSQASIR